MTLRDSVIYALLAAFLLTPILRRLWILMVNPLLRNRNLKTAIRRGHVVEATLDRQYSDYDNSGKTIGEYHYTYKGRRYKCKIVSMHSLPYTGTLYFVRYPSKATVKDNVGILECSWRYIYLVSVVIMTIFFYTYRGA